VNRFVFAITSVVVLSTVMVCQAGPPRRLDDPTPEELSRIMLNGLTATAADELVPLARSWFQPAELRLTKGVSGISFTSAGQDPIERAAMQTAKWRNRRRPVIPPF